METLAIIFLFMQSAYVIYRIIIMYFLKKKNKSTTKVEIKESNIDMRLHSTPSFDFPNVQSELDLRYSDFGHCSNEAIDKLKVREYCKF